MRGLGIFFAFNSNRSKSGIDKYSATVACYLIQAVLCLDGGVDLHSVRILCHVFVFSLLYLRKLSC